MTETPAPTVDSHASLLLASAAAAAAGPISSHESLDAWRKQMEEAAMAIAESALTPRGAIAQIAEDAETMRHIDVVLTGVRKDEKSNRGVVSFRADKPGQYANPDGTETVQTDRLENPGVAELANKLHALGKEGKKLRLTIVNRDRATSKNGKGFRTVVAAEPIDG
ncbi:hypothetical protein [Brachybacterium paraconglomeratum]|uniref:hypothetical protein n=1 Tax=Brachybacterium paraconglomeratum TaxID=173362 RepID=UPI0022AE7F9F|nr:hypothetical protein [Brachybacterium paraconglomeratum]MCZ4326740.1 hypothetical protein [Brachybacterium paraconglomeratum]